VDLKKSPDTLLKLARHADVLIEGFRPGVMDRLGLGYAALSETNPGLIYCSLLGYPSDGEYHNRAGHDINYLALTGLVDINLGQDGHPAMPGLQIADVAGGSMFAVTRILQAVIERNDGGRGQRIEVDMLQGVASLLGFTAAPAALAGKKASWDELLLNGQVACYNLYPTRDGRWMSLGNLEEKFWRNFCDAVGRPDWTDEQFNRSSGFRQTVSDLFMSRTQEEWIRLFRNVDTCVEPVRSLAEAAASGLFHYSDKPAPRLGEHTRSVMSEFGI
jgi:crotonobetainyl-CoA:carnitine CoA-transferase CaiB-like acyl-CoA transferase